MIRNETARLLRRTAPALATLPLALALSGCGTLTGLNAENDFSCPMTPGVSCRSLSDTYEDSVRAARPTGSNATRQSRPPRRAFQKLKARTERPPTKRLRVPPSRR